jgi:hypothetical protein
MNMPAPPSLPVPTTTHGGVTTKKRRKKNPAMTGVPYATATSDMRAREEIKKLLRHFGCEEIGFADKYEQQEVLLYFKHRARQVHLPVSAKGWAQMYLKAHPYNGYRRRKSRQAYEQEALDQGFVAVNSILRDWIKGQFTAIESGILSFEAVFLPHMLTHDGRPLIEQVRDLLPKPDDKVIALLSGPRQTAS